MIRLRSFMPGPIGWSRQAGRTTFKKLLEHIDTMDYTEVVTISLEGVERFDVTFPLESIVALAHRWRCKRGVCVTGIDDPESIVSSLDGAAKLLNQPLTLWHEDAWQIVGPKPSTSAMKILSHVLTRESCTSCSLAADFDLKVQNAGNKLKSLYEKGYILRKQILPKSGGKEFMYYKIK